MTLRDIPGLVLARTRRFDSLPGTSIGFKSDNSLPDTRGREIRTDYALSNHFPTFI